MRRARPEALQFWAPDAVALLTVLVLTGPMWMRGGYGLARDMVFTPRHPWSLDALGMGTSLPRAVPLDAVLAALSSLVDGAVLFRVLVPGVLLLAACGAHRMLPDLPLTVRMLTGVAAVWNPYVVERLALGQWALLAAYAAMWWLLPAARAAREGDSRAPALVVLWCGVGSLTPTGGLLVLLVVGCTTLRRGVSVRGLWPFGVAALAQLPWLLPSLLAGSAAVSDSAGVEAFAARAERSGGVVPTLLGTGGVWSPFVVPSSLGTAFGHLLTIVVVVALLVGGRAVWRREPGLVVAAGVGLLLAILVHLPGGEDVVRWATGHLPGAGLLRDGQKWLMPYLVVVVLAAGETAARTGRRLSRLGPEVVGLVGGVLVLVPVVLLPDAPGATWTAVRPVDYPVDLAGAVSVLDSAGSASGDVITLPWASYREFSWGNPVSAADPLPRWTRHRVVVSDDLRTTDGVVAGEDHRAEQIAEALATDTDAGRRLARLGVGWVLVYRDQPGAATAPLEGLRRVAGGPQVELFDVRDEVQEVTSDHSWALVAVVAAVQAVWALLVLAALGSVIVRRATRSATAVRRRG